MELMDLALLYPAARTMFKKSAQYVRFKTFA
jgi:hypothetical protein